MYCLDCKSVYISLFLCTGSVSLIRRIPKIASSPHMFGLNWTHNRPSLFLSRFIKFNFSVEWLAGEGLEIVSRNMQREDVNWLIYL